ncbi:MAG: hypothetical protein ACD_50C00179G0002 [uncultured bacterium]|nr:MAG: hypothetical protein ACD_50C00179G0002 [uncultured bacterium]
MLGIDKNRSFKRADQVVLETLVNQLPTNTSAKSLVSKVKTAFANAFAVPSFVPVVA